MAEANLGHALLGQGKFDEAIPHLERALQISPGLAQARYDLDAAQAKTPIRQP
jgi:tetratricopeptide (TPR) repeat protein